MGITEFDGLRAVEPWVDILISPEEENFPALEA